MISTLYAYGMGLTAVCSYLLGLFVISRNIRHPLYKSWFYFCESVGTWSLGYFFTMIPTMPKDFALLSSRFSHASGAIIPALFLRYVFIWLGIKKRPLLIICYIFSCILAIFSLTHFVVIDLAPKLFFQYYPIGKFGYVLYVINFVSWVIVAHYFMLKNYKLISSNKRNQMRYFLLGTISGYFGGATCFPLIFGIKIPPYPTLLIIIYVFTTTIAILRYRLMDIKVAITRTGIFIAVYTLVLGLPFAVAIWLRAWLIGIFGSRWWTAPLGLMASLATLGPFIYIYLDRKAEEALLKEQRSYQETLKQASIGMTRIRSLRKLLDLIAHIVTKTVKISYVAIYLFNRDTNEYVIQVSRDKGRTPIPKLTADNPLIKWIMLKKEPLVYDEVQRQMQDTNDVVYKSLEENMRLLTASVIIPSFLEDRFMGFFVLAEKMSGQMYTPEDLNVFQVLASQAALAIENAQFYEEAKEMQEQISQAEKMATIGTMADGLSHQINNRFYALSLIAGDTMDTIKMTDTSNCTPEVKEMVSQINHALERIQANVMQGGEVVRGILKYTRKGETGFQALALDQILDGTLEMVQYKVKLTEIDIVRDYPKDTPKIKGNLTQLQEVFFNLIDNAYDATVERKDILKEDKYRGRIRVSAVTKDTKLEITIEDNGMGVKDEDMKKLFTPFFTTKVSSRRGTGLGLYVINRIITDAHKGRINIESGYKVGTRFIIELPIAA